ncbi:MAG: OmpA family protein [Proteobacteria bacterium]|nr:OmpA family protein [Pseudomonadota bacterium]MBU1737315.1 OmpA family protein [Pseudomonadota bacterium]
MAADEEKKVVCPPAGAPAWMCTFADLMSLLMTFFILLLSFSEMDRQKFKQVAGSMEKAFGVQKEQRVYGSLEGDMMISTGFMSTPLAVKLQQSVEEEMAAELESGAAEMEMGPEGLVLRVKDSIAFELGRAEIKERFLPLLDRIGKIVAEHEALVTVKGHTDNIPLTRGAPFRSNWSLSTARAVGVVEYWSEKFKIPASRMTASGFADGVPLEKNDSAAQRARNRRVEFVIKPSGSAVVFKGLTESVNSSAIK